MAKKAHVGQKSVSSDSSSESLLEARERHWAEAKKMTLFSNAFMTVALEDPLACQHVLRILTGKKDLVVREIRTQYQIAKITLHDAILDILAEDGEGRVLTKLKNKAKAAGISYQQCLQLFMQEEFLRKLSKSGYDDTLILKGGLFIYMLTNFELTGRVKDFYDIYYLARTFDFDGAK